MESFPTSDYLQMVIKDISEIMVQPFSNSRILELEDNINSLCLYILIILPIFHLLTATYNSYIHLEQFQYQSYTFQQQAKPIRGLASVYLLSGLSMSLAVRLKSFLLVIFLESSLQTALA